MRSCVRIDPCQSLTQIYSYTRVYNLSTTTEVSTRASSPQPACSSARRKAHITAGILNMTRVVSGIFSFLLKSDFKLLQ